MLFNLNEFLMAVSFALDFVEMDILGVTSNHGKRTAYISLKIAKELGLSFKALHDIVALSILHDNGVSEKSLHDTFLNNDLVSAKSIERIKEHCIIGEENAMQYPFLTVVKDVIKYHHEKYDGTGFFNLKYNDIPLMSQIIHMADFIEVNFDLKNSNLDIQNKILYFVNSEENKMFSPNVVHAFERITRNKTFWEDLKSDNFNEILQNDTPQYIMELTFEEIKDITGVLSRIIDSKSKYTQRHSNDLADKVSIMADYYKMNYDEKMKLIIAANLHDIGKLAIPNHILDSPNKLSDEEFKIIKMHSYYTRMALQEIKGFEEITEWASNHHEKLNGQGYPFGKTAQELDFNSRLLACLDIYEALTEERPYRNGLIHKEAMKILFAMNIDGLIDTQITQDIDNVFSKRCS